MTKTVFLLINCESGKGISVEEQLKNIQSIKEVKHTYGVYDVVVKVELQNQEHLNDIMTNKIRKMKDIHSALTLLAN